MRKSSSKKNVLLYHYYCNIIHHKLWNYSYWIIKTQNGCNYIKFAMKFLLLFWLYKFPIEWMRREKRMNWSGTAHFSHTHRHSCTLCYWSDENNCKVITIKIELWVHFSRLNCTHSWWWFHWNECFMFFISVLKEIEFQPRGNLHKKLKKQEKLGQV